MMRFRTSLFFISFFLVLAISDPAGAQTRVATIQGVAQATKDGMYVGGVVVTDAAFPKGKGADDYHGKRVEVRGVIRKCPGITGPYEQGRPGDYDCMVEVKSIRVIVE